MIRKKYTILSERKSDDYYIAIEECSSYIRIGTKIFGERKKSPS